MSKEFPHVPGWKPIHITDKIKKKINENENDKISDRFDVPPNWKDKPLTLEETKHRRLFAESTKSYIYPKAMDEYLTECLPILKKHMKDYCLNLELDRLQGELTVKTTQNTFDPTAFLRACNFLQAVTRFVPVDDALPVLVGEDDIVAELVPINHKKKDTLKKRCQRLENADIRLLTKELMQSRLFIHGKSVVVLGPYKLIQHAVRVVTDCIVKNVHPVYSLKRFQILQRLQNDPSMVGKDWSEMLNVAVPKKNVKSKKPHKVRSKKEYNPFPNPPTERKEDKELADGTFHLKYEKKNGYYVPIETTDKKRKVQKISVAEDNGEQSPKKRKLDTNL